jgi:hypothetical protein
VGTVAAADVRALATSGFGRHDTLPIPEEQPLVQQQLCASGKKKAKKEEKI